LAPFERVVRRFHVGADRRGVYELGPVDLSVGDLFAREAAAATRPETDRFLVRPRTVRATGAHRSDRWGGTDRALAGLSEDPSRFAGIREYAPGDAVRRVHPRASARLGRPVVKVFEPSRDREVLIALDVQTHGGAAWETSFDVEEVESLFVVAASLARSLADERASFGLAAAGYHRAESRFAILPPSEAPGQAERVLDLLARLSSHPSAPFERLLATIARVLRPGTTILVVTARDPARYLGHLRRLEQSGCPVVVLACGPNADRDAAHARAAGLAARTARLDGPWRPAAALGLIVVDAVVGVLASPAASAALAGGIGPAVAAHPGGLLAGLAVLRGFAHASLPLAESTVARLLALGTPGLALASLLGGVIAEPFRTRFLGDALGAAIVFVGTAVLALAFTRLAAMATDEGLDWR